jgi:hypothetical protein
LKWLLLLTFRHAVHLEVKFTTDVQAAGTYNTEVLVSCLFSLLVCGDVITPTQSYLQTNLCKYSARTRYIPITPINPILITASTTMDFLNAAIYQLLTNATNSPNQFSYRLFPTDFQQNREIQICSDILAGLYPKLQPGINLLYDQLCYPKHE